MDTEKKRCFDFSRLPEENDKDNWSKYAGEANNLVKQYAQIGKKGLYFQHFLKHFQIARMLMT